MLAFRPLIDLCPRLGENHLRGAGVTGAPFPNGAPPQRGSRDQPTFHAARAQRTVHPLNHALASLGQRQPTVNHWSVTGAPFPHYPPPPPAALCWGARVNPPANELFSACTANRNADRLFSTQSALKPQTMGSNALHAALRWSSQEWPDFRTTISGCFTLSTVPFPLLQDGPHLL